MLRIENHSLKSTKANLITFLTYIQVSQAPLGPKVSLLLSPMQAHCIRAHLLEHNLHSLPLVLFSVYRKN